MKLVVVIECKGGNKSHTKVFEGGAIWNDTVLKKNLRDVSL